MRRDRPIALLVLMGMLWALCATAGLAVEIGTAPELLYADALTSLETGYYEEAYVMFEQLGLYEDSTDYKIYTLALINLEERNFTDAIDRFEILAQSEFLDSGKYERYARGRKAEAEWDDNLAIECYRGLGFLDSNERLIRILRRPTPTPSPAPTPTPTPTPSPSPEPDKPYAFIDEAMGEAIRRKLNKPSGAVVYLSELASIERIEREHTKSKGIQSLEDLRYCVNLRELFVDANRGVSDLSPLKELTQLRRLSLQKNSISDLSPLSGLVGLTTLDISNNKVSDLSPLANMKDLTGLYINGNVRIADLSPLDDMNSLTFFNYSNNQLTSEQVSRFKNSHPSCIVKKVS